MLGAGSIKLPLVVLEILLASTDTILAETTVVLPITISAVVTKVVPEAAVMKTRVVSDEMAVVNLPVINPCVIVTPISSSIVCDFIVSVQISLTTSKRPMEKIPVPILEEYAAVLSLTVFASSSIEGR